MKLNGYSGFNFSVMQTDGGSLFRKQSKSNSTRLLRQSRKQELYSKKLHETPLSYIFDVPKVVNVEDNGFMIEFIHGKPPIEFENIESLKFLVNHLFELMDWGQNKFMVNRWNYTDLKKKLKKIPIKEPYFSKIRTLAKCEKEMPIEVCHEELLGGRGNWRYGGLQSSLPQLRNVFGLE